ncbi:uncharacterized protein LOC120074621 [Benincasa hispida]|uniref:uncharacterized protein LOC120074621 n=1 Tax=Benincasa hispida TaxID=102211 RepID=UPI0019012C1F|nr:uncharacterized protein LOC120074621 [Benincasa hispida]XP_038883723.1 uncharacterized protein LOC120074621 [Benincasa hispida]XP_038883724.1 uncharacterized protein LOC120074621 [Benincasa hispida]XP_038883725.1 uncharacterized protein LOC120074621 [Benincasa hispida]XP_038883726.1 uncharacterized protein LOC120074621 [Benincasa hispida]
MPILPISLAIPNPLRPPLFSFSQSLTGSNHLFYFPNRMPIVSKSTTLIRMGGGPRTYPGGVSKWQWKRMQAKKAKQLLKARLCRERQIYEMRKRAELKAAVAELERPWEVVERAPNLFSVGADEQVKVLADRFQRPGGFDLWTEKDGPQLFQTVDELPSARFFPKGVVHSVRPYRSITGSESSLSLDAEAGNEIATSFQEDDFKTHRRSSNRKLRSAPVNKGEVNSDYPDYSNTEDSYPKRSLVPSSSNGKNGNVYEGGTRNRGTERNLKSSKRELNPGQIGLDRRQRVPGSQAHNSNTQYGRRKDSRRSKSSHSEVYDMSLEHDGSYRFQPMKSRST